MAKSAILYRNLAAGLTASVTPAAVAGLGAANLNDPQPRMRLRVAATALSLIYDLASAQSLDLAALLSTSLVSADKVLLRGSATDATVASQLLLHSNDFANGVWSKNEITIDSTNNTDPFGGSTATKIAETNTASADHRLMQNITANVVPGAAVRASIYAKAAERSWVKLAYEPGAGGVDGNVNFNVSTGVIGLTLGSPLGATITAAASGFYRISYWLVGGSAANFRLYIMDGDNAATAYTGTTGSGVIIAGAQVDHGTAIGNYAASTSAIINPALNTGVLTGVTDDDYNGQVIVPFAQASLRYIRWDVLSASDPIDIGLAPLGLRFSPGINFDYGVQEGLIDLSVRDGNNDTGAQFGIAGPKLRTRLLTFANLSKAEVRDTLAQIDRDIGASGDVLFIEDPEETAINLARDSVWGSYREIGAGSLATRTQIDRWSRSFRLTERL